MKRGEWKRTSLIAEFWRGEEAATMYEIELNEKTHNERDWIERENERARFPKHSLRHSTE